MKFITIWDDIDKHGKPMLADDHPRIPADEVDQVVNYLNANPIVLRTTALGDDYIDGTPQVVPRSFRSDGTWVWSDEVPYYVKKYKVSPGADFIQYMKEGSTPAPDFSKEERDKIVAFIQE